MTNVTNHSDDLVTFCAIYKYRMQMTQERWEYDFTINSMKFMQQTTSSLSEDDSIVCN